MASPHVRRVVMTGSVAAVVAAGAIYGAQLKGSMEARQEHKTYQQLPIENRIRDLEDTRARLLQQRAGYERKIAELEERQEKKRRVEEGNI